MGNALLQVISGQDGSERREMTKRIVCSNNPIIMAFLNRVLNGPLPAYGKLYLRKTSALVATQKALSVLAKQCADASCEPTEVMTRSAVCTRHLTALIRHENPGMTTERRQKIHAVVSALTDTSTAETQGIAPATGILQRAQLLMQQDVPEATCAAHRFCVYGASLNAGCRRQKEGNSIHGRPCHQLHCVPGPHGAR